MNYETGLAKNIHYGDVLVRFGEVLNIGEEKLPFITNNKLAVKLKAGVLQNGDVVIADAAEDETVGKCTEVSNIEEQTVFAGLHTIAVRPVLPFASCYLGYYLNSSAYHDQLLSLMQGTKVLSISKTTIKATVIAYPKGRNEQTKIGHYFQQLDTLIAQHQKKHDKLLNIKKALLEKLFPKQGTTEPALRFKGFSGEWEEKQLGELGYSTSGTSIESEFINDGIYKVVSIGSYSEKSVYTDQGIRAALTDKTKVRVLNKDDLTMILNDKTSSGNIIGRVLLISDNDSFVYNQRTQRIEPYREKYNSQFLYQLLNAPLIREKIIKASQGNTQIYVNWSAIKKLNYLIPDIKEQTKIGNLFKQLDTLITQHQAQLKKLNNIKQACLEKMFV